MKIPKGSKKSGITINLLKAFSLLTGDPLKWKIVFANNHNENTWDESRNNNKMNVENFGKGLAL